MMSAYYKTSCEFKSSKSEFSSLDSLFKVTPLKAQYDWHSNSMKFQIPNGTLMVEF